MEPKFQSSFIPKKPLAAVQTANSSSVVRTTNLFSLIANTVFIVTVLVVGALFLYKTLLNKQIVAEDQEVNDARSAFQVDKIQELIDSNEKMTAISNLLNHHVAVSGLLTFLGQNAVKKVRFDEFKYENTDNNPTLEMKVEAQSYNALAAQGDIFAQNDFIKNPYFSEFAPEENGFVRASFSSNIDPSLVSYKTAIGAAGTQEGQAPAATSTASVNTTNP